MSVPCFNVGDVVRLKFGDGEPGWAYVVVLPHDAYMNREGAIVIGPRITSSAKDLFDLGELEKVE